MKLEELVTVAAVIVLVIVAAFVLVKRSDCQAAGGAYVRAVIGWECVKRGP